MCDGSHTVLCTRIARKKRNAVADPVHGLVGPLAFLCAWGDAAYGLTREQHRARYLKVSQADCHRWAATLDGKVDHVLAELV